MSVDFQASLFDTAPASACELGRLGPTVERTVLSDGAWVDLRRGWVGASDELFVRLVRVVPWRAERRQMYDRVVDVPRLLASYAATAPLPDPVLGEARDRLSAHYEAELGEPFATAGLCLYRDGRDSVAWHGDTVGRGRTEDTMVAIISLGEPRRLLLRPRCGHGHHRAGGGGAADRGGSDRTSAARAGGGTLGFALGHGDLLVMGGSCQRTWEHAVPKTARRVGPRISIQFRPHDVH